MRLIKPTVTGQLVYPPELRFTSSGLAHCTFRLMQDDGEEIVCEIWREAAEDFIENHYEDWQDKVFTIMGDERTREFTNIYNKKVKYPYRNVRSWTVNDSKTS